MDIVNRVIGYWPFDKRATSDFYRYCGMASAVSALELLSMLFLFPVFSVLAGGDTDSAASKVPFFGIAIQRNSAWIIASVALGSMAFRSIAAFVLKAWWTKRCMSIELRMGDSVLRQYLYSPYAFHLENDSSKLLANVVANVNLVVQSGLGGLASSVVDAMLSLAICAGLLLTNASVGAGVFAYLLVVVFIFAGSTRRRAKILADQYSSEVTVVYQRVANALRGIRELVVFRAREYYIDQVASERTRMSQRQRQIQILQDVPRLSLEVALYASVLSVLVLLVRTSDSDRYLALSALYILGGFRVVPAMSRAMSTFAQARIGLRVSEKLPSTRESKISDNEEATKIVEPYAADVLQMRGIYYRYPLGSSDVLADFSLEVGPRNYVGIVGESGAGKTTLLAIILGLLEPDRGELSYGGLRIKSGDENWYETIGFVPQDVFVMDVSLRENVCLGRKFSDTEIQAALTLAGLGQLVGELHDGLNSSMGEGGSRLSAGQRQRLGIARALVRKPKLLLMDEPTSSLDDKTESQICESIEALRSSMAVIVVSHRKRPVMNADIVLTLVGTFADRQTTYD